jgi:hypothetical protein
MTETTVKKVSGAHSPRGEMGQKYLASGKRVSMRLWEGEPGGGKSLRAGASMRPSAT